MKRPVAVSSSTSHPYSTRSVHHDLATPTSNEPEPAARPFSEIPKTKTILGLNVELLKDPVMVSDYMERQAQELGPIYKVVGTPGMPDMVCVVSPQDAEKAFRAGDLDYPQRFPFHEWKQARKELNQPCGIFLK